MLSIFPVCYLNTLNILYLLLWTSVYIFFYKVLSVCLIKYSLSILLHICDFLFPDLTLDSQEQFLFKNTKSSLLVLWFLILYSNVFARCLISVDRYTFGWVDFVLYECRDWPLACNLSFFISVPKVSIIGFPLFILLLFGWLKDNLL